LTFTACGGDDGDDPDTSTEVTSAGDVTSGDDASNGDIPDEIREIFPNITEEQVNCLEDAGADLTGGDVNDAFDVLEQCDLDLSDMQLPDISIPDNITLPDNMTLPDVTIPDLNELADDLTPDELSCLQEEAGGVTPTDLDEARDILEQCGVDPAVLGG
jgi:hypothetical protein